MVRFFRDLFFGTSGGGGTPLDRCWPPLGHLWFDVVDLLEDVSNKLAPIFKDSMATDAINHTFKKTSKDSNKYR